jgi:replicative DNA helicase
MPSSDNDASIFRHISDLITLNHDQLSDRYDSQPEPEKYRTGLADIDCYTGGVESGDLITIVSDNPIERNSLIINLLCNLTTTSNPTSACVYTNSTPEGLSLSLLSCATGLDFSLGIDIQRRDWAKIAHYSLELSESNTQIANLNEITFSEISSRISKLQVQNALGVIVIEDISIIHDDGRRAQGEAVLEYTLMKLKKMACNGDVLIIVGIPIDCPMGGHGSMRDFMPLGDYSDLIIRVEKQMEEQETKNGYPVSLVVSKGTETPSAIFGYHFNYRTYRFINKFVP